MRFHGLAETLLGSPARVAVLKAVVRQPGREWTGREVARAAGISPTQAMAALRVLESEGICWQRRIGRASVWKMDAGHLLARELRHLALLDDTAQKALRGAIERTLRASGAEEAYLFGSVAAGREQPGSDVDILVVFPDAAAARLWDPRLERLRDDIQRRFSAFLQPLVYARAQVQTAQRRHLLQEARTKGIRLEVGR